MAFKIQGPLGEKIAAALDTQPTPQPTPPQETPKAPVAEEPKVEAPSKEVPVVNETTSQPEPSVNPQEVDEPNLDEWDVDETPKQPEVPVAAQVDTPSFDFSELGKSIGLEGIKSKEDLITKVKALQSPGLEGVPDNLRKAIDVARQGGDYLSYLGVSQVDYSKQDPVKIFEMSLYNNIKDSFPGATEQEINEKYQEAIAEYSDIRKLTEGRSLQKQYVSWQQQEQARLEREAVERKAQADTKIKHALDSMEEVNGFKITGKHRSAMFDYITSGELQKDLFAENGYNYEALAQIAFERKFGKKAKEFLWNRAKTTTKKEIVKELTNPQIEKPTEKPQVEVKDISPMTAWLEQLRNRHPK